MSIMKHLNCHADMVRKLEAFMNPFDKNKFWDTTTCLICKYQSSRVEIICHLTVVHSKSGKDLDNEQDDAPDDGPTEEAERRQGSSSCTMCLYKNGRSIRHHMNEHPQEYATLLSVVKACPVQATGSDGLSTSLRCILCTGIYSSRVNLRLHMLRMHVPQIQAMSTKSTGGHEIRSYRRNGRHVN